jgi:hypothetical protein
MLQGRGVEEVAELRGAHDQRSPDPRPAGPLASLRSSRLPRKAATHGEIAHAVVAAPASPGGARAAAGRRALVPMCAEL